MSAKLYAVLRNGRPFGAPVIWTEAQQIAAKLRALNPEDIIDIMEAGK